MLQLIQREARNFQFEFLRPSHSLFPLFTQLLEQYAKVLNPPQKELKRRLDVLMDDRFAVLDRCFERSEWTRYLEETRQRTEKKRQRENGRFLALRLITLNHHSSIRTLRFHRLV